MSVLIGPGPVGDANHSDGLVVEPQWHSEKRPHLGVAARLADPAGVDAGIEAPGRSILEDGNGEDARSERDHAMARKELGSGMEPVDGSYFEGRRFLIDQADEAEL